MKLRIVSFQDYTHGRYSIIGFPASNIYLNACSVHVYVLLTYVF